MINKAVILADYASDLYYGFNDLSDYERGEFDCVHGYPALDNQSDDYYLGYGHNYGLIETQSGACNYA